MHDGHEAGHDPAFLPPFIARPAVPRDSEGADRPLPPWTSERRDVGGPGPSPAGPAPEAGWTPAESAPAEEPWLDVPQPSEGAQAPLTAPEEPWPGLETDTPVAAAGDEPWAAVPEPEPSEEPWAMPAASSEEPWSAEQEEPLVLDEPAAGEPWLETGPAAVEPWLETEPADVPAESAEASPWDDGVQEDELAAEDEPWSEGVTLEESADREPWAPAGAWDAPAVPGDRPESDLPPAPASPLDELVETAGQALAGSDSAWADAPLETWPGEAEAWQAAAMGSDETAPPDAGGDAELIEMAEGLEAIADDLRARGATALEPDAGRDHLGTALAAFLAGWRSAHRHG